MKEQKIFIFAGEKSGDLHGAHFIKAFREQNLPFQFEGVTGPKMRELNIPTIIPMEKFEVMGLSDVIKSLPKIVWQFKKIKSYILKNKPKAVVLIDYPGFNLRLAQALRKGGYSGKIIQYISPSVWAWGKHRIQIMANTLDLLLSIYPFERELFSSTSLNVAYVGSPLKEYHKSYQYSRDWKNSLGIPCNKKMIGLFPGSRLSEVKNHLPIMLEAAIKLKNEFPDLIFATSCSQERTPELFEKFFLNNNSAKESFFLVPKNYSYELMKESHCAIAKSGTVTLELALHECPTIVIYKLNLLNQLYAKHWLKLDLPYYCIVNILANRKIFPELIKEEVTSEKLVKELKDLLTNETYRAETIEACQALSSSLGEDNASLLAAKSFEKIL